MLRVAASCDGTGARKVIAKHMIEIDWHITMIKRQNIYHMYCEFSAKDKLCSMF